MTLTFLNELPPSLGPRRQLVAVGLLYLGTFLQAAHEVVAEPVAVIESLDSALVVPNLRTRGKKNRPGDLSREQKHELPFCNETARLGKHKWGCLDPNIHQMPSRCGSWR